jgi:uncharacterized protein
MRCLRLIVILLSVQAWAQPATLAGFSDQGTFLLYVNEERIGRATFQWKADGTFESSGSMTVAGQSVTGTVAITPDAEGRWIKAVLQENSTPTRVWQREGSTLSFTSPDKNGSGTWPPDVLTFETYTPPLISQALRRYDLNKRGKQTFPVLVLNTELFHDFDLMVELQETVERVANGRTLKLTQWVYAPPGHQYHVLADPDGRVYLASGVPGFGGGISEKNVVLVREGYEALLETLIENGPISQPKFEVEIKRGILAPMRDGVKLSTDLYFPKDAERAPVILVRTCYKKEMDELRGRFYARRGYAVAIQDVRGRFASEGVWEPFVHEAKDGYDTIEWLARQPWSNGKVGMIGASYLGWVQWAAASLRPPHLAAMIPNVSPPDPFHNVPYDNGVLLLRGSLWWARVVESNATADLSGKAMDETNRKNLGELLKALPVMELDRAVLEKERQYWRSWMAHPFPDKYWDEAMFPDKLKGLNVPVFHQSGWFDGDAIGSKINYLRLAVLGHADQKMTIGPWDHTDSGTQMGAERDFGPTAAVDLQRDYLRWFDHWLKGIDNGIMQEPRVSLFVMGSNRWLHAPVYPLPETHFEKLYLSSGGNANTSMGDGKLSFQPPDTQHGPVDHYRYDPGDPTPEAEDNDAARDKLATERKDILVYTTEPFAKAYTIAGPVSAVLYAASSARDTDWFVHLFDVDAEGKSSALWPTSGGHIRARYRKSLAKPELLQPGKIYRYAIDLWHTGVTIPPGHRLRVDVSSAAFPLFERNLNTGGSNETETHFVAAEQTIYHDARHPSYVLLPMIPEKNPEK